MRRSVRMNISVSETLKNKMDSFERVGNDTNWSRVAQEAFEHHMRKNKGYQVDYPVYERIEDIPRGMIEDMLREHGYTFDSTERGR